MEHLLNPPAVIGEAVAGAQAHRATAVRKTLVVLTENIQRSTFDVAELLAEVKSAGYYQAWGFASLGDYATKELDIKERKAQYLCRIVQVCKQVGIKRETYEPIGVSKLREITSLNPDESFFNTETKISEPLNEHIVSLIADAPETSLEDITGEVKRLKGLVGEDEMVWLNYPMKRSVRDNVIIPAQEMARQRLGSAGRDAEGKAIEYSDGQVEEVIHAEFLADPANSAPETDESKEQTDVGVENESTEI